jgi:hypothetical protein
MAHLHLRLLDYWMVNTILHQLKKENIRSGWSQIGCLMIMQKCLTTVSQTTTARSSASAVVLNPKTKSGKFTTPSKHAPFTRKKCVVLKPPPKKSFHLKTR